MNWAVGVTTVPSRISEENLKGTLDSLERAGFGSPLIFVDGQASLDGYEVVQRTSPVKAFGNWCLALQELTFRFPEADRYAIFQDDVLLSKGIKEYVSRKSWEPKTYLNLITYPTVAMFRPAPDYEGWFEGGQRGKGAQGLVFDRTAAVDLLTSRAFFERRFNVELDGRGRPKGTRNIDGGVVDCLKVLDYREVCHYPSLITHLTDLPSALNNKRQPDITSWRGEDYDYSLS